MAEPIDREAYRRIVVEADARGEHAGDDDALAADIARALEALPLDVRRVEVGRYRLRAGGSGGR